MVYTRRARQREGAPGRGRDVPRRVERGEPERLQLEIQPDGNAKLLRYDLEKVEPAALAVHPHRVRDFVRLPGPRGRNLDEAEADHGGGPAFDRGPGDAAALSRVHGHPRAEGRAAPVGRRDRAGGQHGRGGRRFAGRRRGGRDPAPGHAADCGWPCSTGPNGSGSRSDCPRAPARKAAGTGTSGCWPGPPTPSPLAAGVHGHRFAECRMSPSMLRSGENLFALVY